MPTQHTVRAFDEELRGLDNTLAMMGGLAETQLAEAIASLVKRNAEAASRVIQADSRIDALEDEINAQCLRLLALRQPVALDLRNVISVLKISSDVERIGDLAKNIAKRVPVLNQSPSQSMMRSIGRMGQMVQGMIKDVLDAYMERDAAKAEDVRLRDEEVDALHTSLFRELLTYMMEDPRNIGTCTHLLFIAKNIERIGDHATNIAEAVCFLVEGKMPEDERPKVDDSASTVVAPDPSDQ